MGGRGSSGGKSVSGKPYGSEYHSVYQSGNIKFVVKNEGSPSAPMETMTKGRVYVTVNKKNELKNISYYDKNNKRFKQIDVDHYHKIEGKAEKPHRHTGYLHNEKGDKILSSKEEKMLDRIIKTWYYKRGKL